MIDHLEIGADIAANLVDGVKDTPHVTGTLRLDPERGVRVTVPYVKGSPEFTFVNGWFDGDSLPPQLSAISVDARIGLFGCQVSGIRANMPRGTAEGHIDVEEAVLKERDGALADPLVVKIVASEMDGLYEWARLQSVATKHRSEGKGWTLNNILNYTVRSAHGHEWKQGDATVSISTTFNGVSGNGIRLEEHAVLTTKFDDPRPFVDHLKEQRKFVAFLSLMFGTTISFRRHRIRDDRYTTKVLGSGKVMSYPFVELVSRQTIADYSKPVPPKKELGHPIVRMASIDPVALTAWSDRYDAWDRFLLPIVGVYRVPSAVSFVENIAINSAMSLEALGGTLVGYVDGEEATYIQDKRTAAFAKKMKDPKTSKTTSSRWKTVATDIYRGIKPLGIDWTAIADSEIGLARAIANNYNTLKHPSKGSFPDSLHTRILSDISSLVVRLNALKLVTSDPGLLNRHDALQPISRTFEIFREDRLFITHDGKIVVRDAKS